MRDKTPFCFSGIFSPPGNGACPSEKLLLSRNHHATCEASAAGASLNSQGGAGPAGQGGDILVARRVSRVASPPRAQQTSRPPQRGGGWGMAGQSCLRSAALQFPNLPGEGSGEQPPGLSGGSKTSSLPELPGEGWSQPRRQRGGTSAPQRPPPCPHASPGKRPRRRDLFFSVPPGAYIYTYFCSASSCRNFFPPSCGFAVDRGERLRVRALTAPPEKPGSDFPSEKREAERARKGKEPVGAEPAAPERGGGGARGLRYPPTESDPRLSSTPGWPLRSHEALLF